KIVKKEGLPSFTKQSITTLKNFLKELETVRKQGYATDFEEFQDGINAVSAPVSNADKKVIGTLSIVGPAFRMTSTQIHAFAKECVKKASHISELFRLIPQAKKDPELTNYLKTRNSG
ncbi:MAG: IclR family transcriptional regulator C-terminal domain-containing protein, partial [Acidobacteriota bacterium]